MNIVQLNEFEKARKGFSSQEAVGLLRECRELTIRQLSAALVRMMGKVDDALFELAEKAENNSVQSLYFDAMREVRLKRASMEIGFKVQLMDGFNREIRKESEYADEKQRGVVSADDLNLVEHDALEETLAVASMVSKVDVDVKDELGPLNRRIGYLLNDPELARAKNPIGPEVVCNAFREACGDVDSGIKVKLIIMKLFDRYVVDEEMLSLYHDVNRLLIERNVLPELRHESKRAAAIRHGSHAKAAPGSAAHEDGAISDEDVFATLQQLMYRGLPGGIPAAIRNAGMSNGGMSMQGANIGVMQTLTKLQQGSSDMVAGAGMRALNDMALSSGMINVIRNIQASGVVGNLGAADSMIIDVVAMLFDYILDDADIPPAMKALIGRLQIPMLKVGMLDKSFFSRKTHPARKLLNLLAEAAVGWDGGQDQALYKKIESIMQRVLVEFDNDVSLFGILLEDLEAFLASEKQKAVHLEDQSTRLVQGRERLRLAKNRVLREVEYRCKRGVPKFVKQFLLSYWQNLLLVTLIKESDESIAWKRNLTAMDNLVWSLQSKATVLERERLLRLLPGLLRVLREGMELVSMREEDFQGFLEQLSAAHAAIVNAVPRDAGAEVAMVQVQDDPLDVALADDAEPAQEDKAVTTATIHRLVVAGDVEAEEVALAEALEAADLLPEADAFSEQVSGLQQGVWVEFTQEDGSALRAKLTWVSPVTGVYLFTNRQGLKACDKTLQSLANELRGGTARVLDDAPLFDRAVNSLIDGLRKQATG